MYLCTWFKEQYNTVYTYKHHERATHDPNTHTKRKICKLTLVLFNMTAYLLSRSSSTTNHQSHANPGSRLKGWRVEVWSGQKDVVFQRDTPTKKRDSFRTDRRTFIRFPLCFCATPQNFSVVRNICTAHARQVKTWLIHRVIKRGEQNVYLNRYKNDSKYTNAKLKAFSHFEESLKKIIYKKIL